MRETGKEFAINVLEFSAGALLAIVGCILLALAVDKLIERYKKKDD
tara:strand:- start:1220 stop:1357 length:138 start_codon:yes stop_codon:yes gene_type:complete